MHRVVLRIPFVTRHRVQRVVLRTSFVILSKIRRSKSFLRTSFVILSKIRKDRHVNMYPTSPRAQGCPSDPFRYFLTPEQRRYKRRSWTQVRLGSGRVFDEQEQCLSTKSYMLQTKTNDTLRIMGC